MGKSVNEYYAEKMKKLLEMQNGQKPAAVFAPQQTSPKEKLEKASSQSTQKPQRQPQNPGRETVGANTAKPPVDGRGYYDSFRQSGVSTAGTNEKMHRGKGAPEKPNPRQYAKPGVTLENDRKPGTAPPNRNGAKSQIRRSAANKKYTQKKSPEQTFEDKLSEEERREEARLRAERGKRLRKLRDNLISVFLMGAVAVVLCIVVYRLVFVISDINIEGAERYSKEEILAASGVAEGDHLYSFRNSSVEKLITLRCPAVGGVTVDKVAPSTVNLYINEEPAMYYADFFGEYRELSESLRVLYAVSRNKAEENNLIRIKLPLVKTAYSGKKAEFSGVRSDAYIYDVTAALKESQLWGRIKCIDLRNKYDIALNCDGRFIIELGDSSSVQTKLKIAAQVLSDSMFEGDVKAKIDVSALSATGVVTDNNLDMSRFS